MAEQLPLWLQDQCRRLTSTDEKVLNLNLNIRRVDNGAKMAALVEALQLNSDIESLNLVTSLQSNEHAFRLFAAGILRNHCSLKSVFLSYNRLQNMVDVGTALMTNSNLLVLDLDYNRIGPDGAAALASGLSVNQSLEKLSLSWNRIGDDGTIALAEALRSNQSLHALSLRRNDITNVGADALQKASKHSTAIYHIDVENNFVCIKGAALLRILCQANRLGRRFVHDPSFSMALWPLVLQKAQSFPDVLYLWTLEQIEAVEGQPDKG